ncbi:unnamed protein product [Adineta steineri]|uniref:G-protein coupled receptors family 1 profile domain-containing protein n=1 Tax=Adineta steineri TaxID=433720 RepID=A0A819SD70_9BILA|nr:unnamed protein product [Adineta steineri]
MDNLVNETAYLNFIAQAILMYGCLALFICGIIGSTPVFLLFSFAGSLTTFLTGLLPQLVAQFSGTDPLATYLILCKLRWFIGIGSATVALHCLGLAALNQYLLTSRDIGRHSWITRRRAVLMSLFVIIFFLGLISPNLVYYTHTKNSINMTQCVIINPTAAIYNTYNGLVIYSLLPIIILSTFSLLTWWNLRNKMVRRAEMERSLTRLVFAQITMVLLASTGYVIRRMYQLYSTNIPDDAFQVAQNNVFNSVFTLIGFIIHTFSFFTYFFSSDTFRQKILSLFFKRKRQIQPTTNPIRNTT